MKSNTQVVQELSAAMLGVQKLTKHGYKVLNVSLGNRHPLISIQPPKHQLKGAEPISVRCRQGVVERIYVAKFLDCLVTWAADAKEAA